MGGARTHGLGQGATGGARRRARDGLDLDGAFEGRKVEIVGVKKCEGDASVVMIRGKPRHGFDFETTLEWRATFEAEREKSDAEDDDDDDDGSVEVCGTISIPEFSRDCAEDEECGYEIQFNSRKSELRTREDACFSGAEKARREFPCGRRATDRRRATAARVGVNFNMKDDEHFAARKRHPRSTRARSRSIERDSGRRYKKDRFEPVSLQRVHDHRPRSSKISACSNSVNTRSFLFAGNGYLVPKLLKWPLTAFNALYTKP